MCGLIVLTWSVNAPWPPKDSAIPDEVVEPETNSTPTAGEPKRPFSVHWPAKNVWMSPENAARSLRPLARSEAARLLRSPSQPLHSPTVNGWPGALSSAISIIDVPHSFHAAFEPVSVLSSHARCLAPSSERFGSLASSHGVRITGPSLGAPSQGGGAAYWCRSVRIRSACTPSG